MKVTGNPRGSDEGKNTSRFTGAPGDTSQHGQLRVRGRVVSSLDASVDPFLKWGIVTGLTSWGGYENNVCKRLPTQGHSFTVTNGPPF